MSKPRLAVTLGDPAGIGPEIVYRAVNSLKVRRVCSPVIFGDEKVIKKYLKRSAKTEFFVSSSVKDFKIGKPSKESGTAAYEAVKAAARYCLQGKASAMATAPVSKESFKLAGIMYPGHTELLASITKSANVAMMMACGKMHGVMATRHIPLAEVSGKLKAADIAGTVKLAARFLKKTGKKDLKIVLCGLNPHAGDNSILGAEEKNIIYPAYKILKRAGYNVFGPLPADSAWLKTKNGGFDLICGMYHDQVMIPLKCIAAEKIVNVTAGLPFVRTSPGHGTAFDIAGKNIADPSAMIEALLYAAKKAGGRS